MVTKKKDGHFIHIIAVLAIVCITITPSLVTAQQSPIIGTFSDNLAEIQIYSFTTSANISYYPYSPEYNGYVWVILDISIKNVASTGTTDTNSLFAYLKDNQGFIYRGRSLANDPQNLKLMDLNPGDIQRGNLYFEIPATSKIVGFYWDDYKSNIAYPPTIQTPTLPAAISSKSDNRAQIQIYSLKTSTTIPYYPYSPSNSGYIWACLDISLKNLGTGTLDTNSLFGYLKDDQAYSYRGRSLANDPKDIKLMDLKSGDIQRGNLYFEIPSSANIVSFYWSDYLSNIQMSLTGSPEPSPTLTANPNLSPTQTPTLSSTATQTPNLTPTPTVPEYSLITIPLLAIGGLVTAMAYKKISIRK